MGLPDQSYSFSGGLRPASKVVLVFVMVRGRHRGLPRALDRAVKLPGWEGEGLGGEGGGFVEEGDEGKTRGGEGGCGSGNENGERGAGMGLRKRRCSKGFGAEQV